MKLPYRLFTGSCEQENEIMSSTKEENFFDYLSDYQLLENNSCPCS